MKSVVVIFITLALSACNECEFWQQCGDGASELVVCGEGIDQQVGRTPRTLECPTPNSVCVDLSESYGACAFSSSSCAENDPPRCEGDVLVRCMMAGDTAEVEFPDIAEGADEELIESGETCANGCADSGSGAACIE
jgi:hypothetical protein